MRFLCLHGRGTNAQILQNQTARIREALGKQHEFVFIDGIVPAKAMNGVTQNTAYGAENLGFWPLESGDEEQFRQLYHDLSLYIGLNGPFEGLVGFSEGASVAATIMIEDARRRQVYQHVPHEAIKCGIFFCGLPPLKLWEANSEPATVRFFDSKTDGTLLDVPTAHIWSSTGTISKDLGRVLMEMSAENQREKLVHGLGHDIPGARSEEALKNAILVIERTIERAKDY